MLEIAIHWSSKATSTALLAEGVRAAYVAHRCAFVINRRASDQPEVAGPEEGR